MQLLHEWEDGLCVYCYATQYDSGHHEIGGECAVRLRERIWELEEERRHLKDEIVGLQRRAKVAEMW
jgi:DNA repair photolyase